ncbi:hypothetical protein VaNZ11_008489 [Volvox africanus]|uniref:Protein kinase domain-containing protein n=1 Tax=Volvox africanus TaxID=51714 RepID=A0ABQ5S5V6_9CHLO|nr:hypothetical protein VaNZ11_008489 [Volvox africanus]
MESPGNTLALRLVGQQEVWSPNRGTGPRQEVSCFPSVTSSPCSASSICSTTFLVNYGADMNRDFAVITLLEEKLGREVEHEELQTAIANFRLVHGQLPSIRQLVLEMASRVDGLRCREDAELAAGYNPDEGHLPAPLHSHHNEGASPCANSRDEHSLLGSLRARHSQGNQLGLQSHGPLARVCSPGARPQQGPSRFCPWDSPGYRPPHLLQRQFEREPSPATKQLPFPGANADLDTPGSVNMAADVPDAQQPVARPFVPGLNLRDLKKKSSPLRTGASPPAASGNATPVQHLHAPGIDEASNDRRTSDTCSPSEILRMLLPSACKPRPSANANGLARTWNAQLAPSVPLHPELALAEGDGAAHTVNGASPTLDMQQLGCKRVSLDDLDQQQTGFQRTTPMKELHVTKSDATTNLIRHRQSPMFISSAPEKDQCTTPVPRGRRSHLHDQVDQGLDHVAYHTADTASFHGSAKRHLVPPEQSNASNAAIASNTCDVCSLVDSDLRKDTPSKAGAAVAIARHAAATGILTMSCTHPEHDLLPRPVVAATGAADQGMFQQAMPQNLPQLQGVAVPPLRLPVTYPPVRASGASATQLSTRRRPWSTNSIPSNRPTAGVPLRPLSPIDWGRRQLQPLPTGARTRRLSVCLPSAMVYGEGPLTTRRMATGANIGVTSHALCTVFWAESEDDLDLYDSEPYDTDELDKDAHGEEGEEVFGFPPVLEDEDEMVADGLQCAMKAYEAAKVVAAESLPLHDHPSDGTQLPKAQNGRGKSDVDRARGSRRCGRLRRRGGGADGLDPDRCGGGLMLPEQLWDAWERLSDGPKGRQYRLLESLTHVERITCTSYSTVSKACHQGQPVVVKIYDVAERDKLANAFAEIGVLLHLSGWPGAVRLLDYGRHEDKVMLMLESCDHSLKDWCDGNRFETATGADYIVECLRLWCTLAELLTELHERWHVAHCDLKPGNVLLSGGKLRLADFSESMLFNETPLLQDQARGTVPYQPPEMVHGHCVDACKADVWAMGCILYEMITGELLFRGNSDCMRAVAAGAVAARLRQQQAHRYSSRRGARSGSDAQGRPACTQLPPPQQQPWPQHCDGSMPEPSAPGTTLLPQSDAVQWSAHQAEFAFLDYSAGDGAWQSAAVPETGREAAAAPVVMTTPPPRVPRLPLVQTHGSGVAGSPRENPPQPPATVGSLGLAYQGLPPHFLLGVGGGSAMVTGRSLQLIAEGCITEDACSFAIDASVANTAPTTARSTAHSHMPYGYDTARSIASSSTAAFVGGCWPPAPPPSTGTARSVADSEWTLAVTTTAAATTAATAAGVGFSSGARCFLDVGPSSIRSTDIPGHDCIGAGAGERGEGEATEPLLLPVLPPHRRLRHSVATQCADPAGPDWLTTEEADRLRIMCDEAPSFVLVHYQGGGGGTSSSPVDASDCASSRRQNGENNSDVTAIAAELRDLYEPRPLSGVGGPSLCDDVMGLLRAILVEDHARPNMRQVTVLATAVLLRHCPPPARLQPCGDSHGTPVAGASVKTAHTRLPRCSSTSTDAELALVDQAEFYASPIAIADAPTMTAAGLSPRLCLSLLQERPSFCYGDITNNETAAAAGGCSGGGRSRPLTGGTDGGSWADSSSSGDDSGMTELCGSGGSTAAAASGRSARRSVSLFDISQPLLTSRGSWPSNHSWQRFLS